jgi:plasmid stability protein
MSQLTIRRLAPTVIEGLKKRAAAAGRSMEEEARTDLE